MTRYSHLLRFATLALLLHSGVFAADATRDSGKDHVGKPVPNYMTGDECLFCHRNEVGNTWSDNAHAWTTRSVDTPPIAAQLPSEATHVIGNVQAHRALKQSGYGRFAMFDAKTKTWRSGVFEQRCAGCHTTGVDPATGVFASVGLDCFTCHGDVPTEHTTQPELAWLGGKHTGSPRLKQAICAQCHLRGGQSRSTGKPFPNNFVAGDDLFADFTVDLAKPSRSLDKNDAHSYTKTRAVLDGKSKRTCADCHTIHTAPAKPQRDTSLYSDVCDY
jgi:hypothetical protein